MTEVMATNAAELAEAVEASVELIRVEGTIAGSPMVTLPPGVTLSGGTLELGAKGIRLTRDNTLDGVKVVTAVDEVAILNDTSVADLGTLTLRDVYTRGQVLLLAEDAVQAGHIGIDGLTVETADVRGRATRPRGFGVERLQGAVTIWNRQADPAVTVSAELLDVSAGTSDEPVAGSGVLVGGHGDWSGKPDGGTVRVSRMTTGEIVPRTGGSRSARRI